MENWKSCPACKRKKEILRAELDSKYGRVTKEEYTRLQEEFEKAIESNDSDATMRINYEYYWDDEANAVMDFYAKCDRCGAEWIIYSVSQPKEETK